MSIEGWETARTVVTVIGAVLAGYVARQSRQIHVLVNSKMAQALNEINRLNKVVLELQGQVVTPRQQGVESTRQRDATDLSGGGATR